MLAKSLVVLAVLGSAALFAGAAPAQVVVYDSVVTAPAITYSPVVTTYSPIVTAPPTVIYRPPVFSYSPAITTYSPVVSYSPVVTTYSPVVTAYSPVFAARPILIRPKVYVAGQPVRNFFRAITP